MNSSIEVEGTAAKWSYWITAYVVCLGLMILGLIILLTHDETTLGAIEGHVLDDSENTNIT